ncbi:hypothetical protein ATANTOWER_018038 [Ataeniobius toweri]|uniref:Uncharacterized protein n=1 Tax=Ataeniobius toweri TaxID=208326 RepID=A0ABU7B4R4_9TELE|nr:hypothetical protein [Ataeniobius toweri]
MSITVSFSSRGREQYVAAGPSAGLHWLPSTDGWCLEAFTLAQGRMLEELTNVLVMLVVGQVAHYQLMKCNAVRAFVQRREYLTWPGDPQDLQWFYERLVSLILRDTKVKKFPVENPKPVKPERRPPAEEEVPLENIKAVAN